ncbi:MAG: hypothetical protein KF865_02685 [Bdellovibrionaceae bacterium]|nr:hypothetical protein [Pseudobdellovibrionaceae bacterium]
MTEFLVFGLIVLMTWSLQRFTGALALLLQKARRASLSRPASTSSNLLVVNAAAALMEPSMWANRVQAAMLQNFRLRSWRANLLLACLSFLGLWAAFLAANLFLNISGLFLLSVGGVILILSTVLWPSARAAAQGFFFLGLFLWAGESSLRFTTTWVAGATTDWSMLLADGRFVGSLCLFGIGLLSGALLRLEFLMLSAALVGLSAGVLSVNGAVALWLGERAGLMLALAFSVRHLTKSTRLLVWKTTAVTVAASFIALLLLGYVRDVLGPVSTLGSEGVLERLSLFLMLSAVMEAPVALSLLIWGHREGSRTPEDLFEVKYAGEKIWRAGGLRRPMLIWMRDGLVRRRADIGRFRGEFNETDWQKVPPAVRNASTRESEALESLLQTLDSHLLSRSDFFDDHRG